MRILFITSNRIGDAVLSNGVLQSMLEQYPGARVTVVAGGAATSLYEAVPGLEEIISLKKQKHHIHWLKLWGKCFRRYWDVVVDMRRSGVSYFLLAGRRLIVPAKDEKLHRIVELSRMLENETTPSPVVWTDPLHDGRAFELVPTGSPVLAVGPAANWSGKQWPIDRFIALVEQLTGDGGILPGARLAILAAPQEREQILSLYSVLPQERVIDLVGQDLVTVAACLRRCDLFIGNDSGLMHLAAAAGTRTLGLFGPSPEWRYHPWGADCACVRTPEGYKEMTNHPEFDYSHGVTSYMESLTLETVVTAAEELYRRGMK
ncbi:glycosyltransferase family 9 protein [Kiloniella laminariae]|uniref:Glycosyltransferase family 9 protein n=1 Tax=Kiloniella laminariae TaxID=454162 RepID=A0ABT4LEN1_9PROT|nr:glycosyltransferase family 9 protein [Kiloniella laminariae]MCZ4279561.1 glycosyltransferase family 9 protein [Kiloniella laminariae]